MMHWRPTWMEVDLSALEANFRAIRAFVGPGCQVLAVVKANAYGLGLIDVVRALIGVGCQRLAVATADEAASLRDAGINEAVLVLGPSPLEAAPLFVAEEISSTVTDLAFARALSEEAQRQGKPARIHLKVDTGMGRLGFLPKELPSAVESLLALPGLDMEGLFTHFAVADEADGAYTRLQFLRFGDILDGLRNAGIGFRLRHCCNSAALMAYREMHLDAVRPGLALYGMWPSADGPRPITLRPAFQVKSRIALIRHLSPSSGVSYGLTYMTRGEERIAVIPIGYHDGYRRGLSRRGEVLIRGKRAPVVGTICMDQTLVNVTSIPEAQIGDEVVLIGEQGGEIVSPEEIASLLGTINYEVPGFFTPRVPRVIVRSEGE